MSIEDRSDITFEIRGARCPLCDCEIAIHIHCRASLDMLTGFIEEHLNHPGFCYRARVSSPPEMVTGQIIEMAFTVKGRGYDRAN